MSTSSVEIQYCYLIWMWGPTDFWLFHFQWSDSPTGMNVLASHSGFTFMAVVSLQTCSVLNGLGKLIHPHSSYRLELLVMSLNILGKNSINDDVCTWKSHSSKLKRSSPCSTVPLSPISPKARITRYLNGKPWVNGEPLFKQTKRLTSNRCRNRSKTNCFRPFCPALRLPLPPVVISIYSSRLWRRGSYRRKEVAWARSGGLEGWSSLLGT